MDDENRYACEQYLDALVTFEIAARLAVIDRRPVNRAIRSCWSAIRPRIDNKLNRQIFDGMGRCACCAVSSTRRSARKVMMETDEDDLNVIICYINANKDYDGPAFVDMSRLRERHLAFAIASANLALWDVKLKGLLENKRGRK